MDRNYVGPGQEVGDTLPPEMKDQNFVSIPPTILSQQINHVTSEFRLFFTIDGSTGENSQKVPAELKKGAVK